MSVARSASRAAVWQWAADHRITLSFIVFSALLVEDILERQVPREFDSLGDPVGLCGMLLVLAGVALRSWAAGHLDKGRTLTDTGPYALCRHPLYLGSMLAAAGFCVLLADIENVMAAVALAGLVYVPKIIAEERKLRRVFADAWDDYTGRVGRVFTPPWRVRLSCLLQGGWRARTWLANHEYRFAIAATVGLIVLEIAHESLAG